MLCAVERCGKTLRKNDPSLFQPQPYEAPSTGHPHLKPCLGKGAQVHASPCHVLDALLPPPTHPSTCALRSFPSHLSQCCEWDRQNLQSHFNLCSPSGREWTPDAWAHGRMFGPQGDQHLPRHRAYISPSCCASLQEFHADFQRQDKVRAWAMQWESM